MRINGRVVQGKNRKTVVLPREGEEAIVIIAEAVSDIDGVFEFIQMPEPPVIQKPTGIEKNFADKGYKEQLQHFNVRRMAWIMIESLKPSNIEWSLVREDDPSTWTKWGQEFKEAGFSPMEVSRITDAVLEANALDEEKLEAARKVFLHGQAAAKNTSGQSTQA